MYLQRITLFCSLIYTLFRFIEIIKSEVGISLNFSVRDCISDSVPIFISNLIKTFVVKKKRIL